MIKRILLRVSLFLLALLFIAVCLLKLYLPTGTIILETTGRGRTGNQLFQYSAAYALAKQTGSKIYLLIDKRTEEPGHVMPSGGEYALGEFNIPKENIIYKNKFNRFYFEILYEQNSNFAKFMRKILNVEYLDEANFFRIARIKNNKILVMQAFYESFIFSQDYKEELLKKFDFTKLDTSKLQPLVNEVALENSVCVHVRRGDMVNLQGRFISINFQKQAIRLAQNLIEQPKFFIFSDDIAMVSKELQDVSNLKFMDARSPNEDLYLMSKCANNIITKSTFSWWAAYLNQNNGLVIAPYNPYNEAFFQGSGSVEEKYVKKSLNHWHYPENWVLLDEDTQNLGEVAKEYILDDLLRNKVMDGYVPREFNIYTGNRIELDVCKGRGDFRPNLCFLNDQLNNHVPTVVTVYDKNKHKNELEWIKNFLEAPFNLIVYTDKENFEWMRKLRGDLSMVLLENNLKGLESKHHFVSNAIKFNPYRSNFFIWCDIEAFKDKKYIQSNFSDKLMTQDKMSIFMLREFEDHYFKTELVNDNITRVQSNIQVADIRVWQIYGYLYDLTKKDLMGKKVLSNKDQAIISTMVMRYPKLFNLIYQDPRNLKDRYLYGLLYYQSEGVIN